MKEAIMAFVILLYVVPFTYIFVADIADVVKRLNRIFAVRLKPALVVMVKSFMN